MRIILFDLDPHALSTRRTFCVWYGDMESSLDPLACVRDHYEKMSSARFAYCRGDEYCVCVPMDILL